MNKSDLAEIEASLPPPPDGATVVYIYALLDPETGMPRYIGKSIRPVERLQNHMNDRARCHRTNWLRSLAARGLRPELLLLESVAGEWPWQESERFWIAYGRAHGWPLTNGTDGGDGVPGLSEESRRRITAAWKGRKHRPETIAKLKAARAGRVTTAATRARMSASQRGRAITWGAKLSAALAKFTPDQERAVRERLARGERVVDLAAEFGVHRTTISKIKKGTYR